MNKLRFDTPTPIYILCLIGGVVKLNVREFHCAVLSFIHYSHVWGMKTTCQRFLAGRSLCLDVGIIAMDLLLERKSSGKH